MSEPTPEIQYAQSDTPQPWTVAVGFIAMRLLGLYYVVQTVTLITLAIPMFSSYRTRSWYDEQELVPSLIITLVPAAIGAVLIVLSKRIAEALFTFPGVAPARVDADQVVRLGTVVLGLWLTVSALPQMVRAVIDIIESIRQNMDSTVIHSPGWIVFGTPLLDHLLPFVLGVFLFFRPGWVVGQFRKRTQM